MRGKATIGGVGVAALLALAGTVSAEPGGSPAIPLNPEQETNEVISGGSGFFSYTIEGGQFCYTLEVRDLTGNPVGAHIHSGARNVAGGIMVHLITPPSPTSTVSDCITAQEGGNLTPAELAALQSDPRAFYVNVHTQSIPQGAVRGQLLGF